MKQFKATITRKDFSQVGRDSYKDKSVEYIYANTLDKLYKKFNKQCKNTESRGDFGCILSSTSYTLDKIEEVELSVEKVIKKVLVDTYKINNED